MELHVLGSGGFMPFPDAHMPAFLIRHNGQSYLFDAGEGTQTRMVEAGLSRADLRAVFVSHMHGDHVLGLPGVVIRRSQEGGTREPLSLYGPPALEEYVSTVRESLGFQLTYDLRHKPLSGGRVFSVDDVWVGTVELDHRTETYGFAMGPRRKKRKFHPDKARELGVPEGPLWGTLQEGESVTLDDGRTIEPEQVSDPPEPGPKIVYLPDTRPVDEFPDGFRNPDCLVHEAMFLEEHREHAEEKKHSTAREAARVARTLDADQLLLTHRSRRYNQPERFLDEAGEVFEDVQLARDGQSFTFKQGA
jgi:ribonuclease Z